MYKFAVLFLTLCINVNIINTKTFEVTNTNSAGNGSLNNALDLSNKNLGADTVVFKLSKSDKNYDMKSNKWTILLNESLPYLTTGYIYIDGLSQNIFSDISKETPSIIIKNSNNLQFAFGIFSPNNRISGFIIQGFKYGILIYTEYAKDNIISDNIIGTLEVGNENLSNENGILIGGNSTNSLVVNNLISGNIQNGIMIFSSKNNKVVNNKIGTDISGTNSIPNLVGISISKSENNEIGPKNIISGNKDIAVLLVGKNTRLNKIIGNLIGTDSSGKNILHNDKGIVIKSLANSNQIGGTQLHERNIISGNLQIGIYIEAADSNVIIGNYIGTDITGTNYVASENKSLMQGNGVEFNIVAKHNRLGGFSFNERNIISGNKVYGIVYYGNCSYNPAINNFIGTDYTSTNPLPNATGICFDCASNHNDVIKNVISGNISYGLFFVTRGTYYNKMIGNMVGVDSSGTIAVPNDIGMVVSTGAANNIIGGEKTEDRNIFSGNKLSGLMITNTLTEYNIVKGNYFGTDITGTTKIPNLYGIMLSSFPKHNTIDSNLISGNLMTGIILNEQADSNLIINNLIGTDISKQNNLGNGSVGIYVDNASCSNIIGTDTTGNLIAYNNGAGILLQHNRTKYNRISGNSIYENNGLGIDIFPYGPNKNDYKDTDDGTQSMLNYPVIELCSYDDFSQYLTIQGTVDCSYPEISTVELFESYKSSKNSYAQGKKFLGIAIPNSEGKWKTIITNTPKIDQIVAVTIDKFGNTSEFSEPSSIITGLDETIPYNLDLVFYPIPSFEKLHIKNLNNTLKDCIISIYTINGELVSKKESKNNETGLIILELKDSNGVKLSNGEYLICIFEINNLLTFCKPIIIR